MKKIKEWIARLRKTHISNPFSEYKVYAVDFKARKLGGEKVYDRWCCGCAKSITEFWDKVIQTCCDHQVIIVSIKEFREGKKKL